MVGIRVIAGMKCQQCHYELGHATWCTILMEGRSLSRWSTPSFGDPLDLPLAPSPVSWLMGDLDDLDVMLPMVDPRLDISWLEGEDMPESFLTLLGPELPVQSSENTSVEQSRSGQYGAVPNVGGPPVAVVAPYAPSTSRMPHEGGANELVQNTDGPLLAVVAPHPSDPSGLSRDGGMNLYASDSSLGLDDEVSFPTAVPGWNVTRQEEVSTSWAPNPWASPEAIADKLVGAGVEATSSVPALGDHAHYTANVEEKVVYERISESPASPDAESGEEARSESSVTAMEEAPYAPIVSPISEGLTPRTPPSPPPRVLEASPIQNYWSRVQAKAKPAADGRPSRIALIQPKRKAWGPMTAHQRRRHAQRVIRIVTQAPVVSSQSILSRTILPDGSMNIETLDTHISMACTRSTQTVTPLFADVQTGIRETDLPHNVVVIRVGSIVSPAVPAAASGNVSEAAPANARGTPATMDQELSDGTPLLDE